EVRHFRMTADNRVLVKGVVIVVPCPGTGHLHRLERRHPGGEQWPYALLEPGMVDLEVPAGPVLFFAGRQAGDVLAAFRPEIDARWIDDQRTWRQRSPAVDDEDKALARLHRQQDAEHTGNLSGRRPGSVDEAAAGNPAAIGQRDRADRRSLPLEADHLSVEKVDTAGAGTLAEQGKQAPRVEPSLAGQAECAAGKSVDVQPRESLRQLGRREKGNLDTVVVLDRDIGLQHANAVRGCEQKIALAVKTDIRLGAEMVVQVGEKEGPVAGHANVFRG